jgi:hypothetical protein
MSVLEKLYVTFEQGFESMIEEVANLTTPRRLLPDPIIFRSAGDNWYLRSICRVVSRQYSMTITGAGTRDLNNSFNVAVNIELDLHRQKRDGYIIFTS